MPGLAAFTFMLNRKGVVLFWNYFMKNMFGGHIDLWNQIRIGNNFTDLPTENFTDGEGAFLDLARLYFGPWIKSPPHVENRPLRKANNRSALSGVSRPMSDR
jgi:hypothetical protein